MNARGRGAHGTRYYVRDAAPADLEAVLTMKAASWREAYGHVRDEAFFAAAEATLDRQVEIWRRFLADGNTLWMAEDTRGRCVGMAAAGPVHHGPPSTDGAGFPELQLYSIYVLASAQGSGVADALLERAIGTDPCLLWVLAGKGRARAFYQRHGFADVGAPVPMEGPWAGVDEQMMVRRVA